MTTIVYDSSDETFNVDLTEIPAGYEAEVPEPPAEPPSEFWEFQTPSVWFVFGFSRPLTEDELRSIQEARPQDSFTRIAEGNCHVLEISPYCAGAETQSRVYTQYLRLFESLGFTLVSQRDTDRFDWDLEAPPTPPPAPAGIHPAPESVVELRVGGLRIEADASDGANLRVRVKPDGTVVVRHRA